MYRNWDFVSFGTILATVGGTTVALFGAAQFVLQHYEGFAYDKSMIKQLFTSEKSNSETTNVHTIFDDKLDPVQEELRAQVFNRQEISFSYLKFLLLYFFSNFCCCIGKTLDTKEHDGHWYRRNMQQLRKFEMAREKLSVELELKFFVETKRIQRFIRKFWINQRQCQSVSYFRHYKIEDVDILEEAS